MRNKSAKMMTVPRTVIMILLTTVAITIATGAETWNNVTAIRCKPAFLGENHVFTDLAGDSISSFIQSAPQQDSAATEPTVVKIFADSASLGIIARCYDSQPERIERTPNQRDDVSGDYFTAFLSGMGDDETGYMFRVNAAGVQSDAVIINDGRNSDYSWDGVWHSEVRIDSLGWRAVIRIPFKTMHYSQGVKWKIGFKRYIPRKAESDWWPAVKVEQGLRISKLAELKGIEPGRPGMNVELYPVVLIKYDRLAERRYSPNAGLDLSWLPNQASKLMATVNPDFAQIESDPDRINLGRYEQYYEEKRLFFITGSEKFSTPIWLVYWRRIGKILPDGRQVPIWGAAKYQAHFGRYDLSLLGAWCGRQDYSYYGADTTEPATLYPVVRIKRGWGRNSSVGILCGAKESGLSYNRVYGLDAVWRRQDLQWSSQAVVSQEAGKKGFAYKTKFVYEGASFMMDAYSERYDADFRGNALGLVYYSGEDHCLTAGPSWWQKGPFQCLGITFGGDLFKLEGEPKYTKVSIFNIYSNFKPFGASISVNRRWQYEMDSTYSYWNINCWLWKNGGGRFYWNPGFDYNTWTYNYRRGYFAPNGKLYLFASYRLFSNINLSWQGNLTLEWKPDRSWEQRTWIHELWYQWSFTRDIHLKIYYTPNLETHYHRANLLLSYNFAPKSWIYLAFNEGIDNSSGRPKTGERVITFKISKLFWW